LLKFTRHAEWYEPKLLPLLGLGYLVIYLNRLSVKASFIELLFLIASIAIGAVYVSVINDVCDVKEDVASGKSNTMKNLSAGQKALVLSTIIAAGIVCGYFIYPDELSLLFYVMSWIVFSLYSIYPFRFKERGILGVLCDASGAHLFPSLFIISGLMHAAGQSIHQQWIIFAGIWAFSYGLRGILWHQFHDRGNDITANISTFATQLQPANFVWPERVILTIELICLVMMIYPILNSWLLVAVVLYILLMVLRKVRYNIQPIIILERGDRAFSIVMHDFYLVFFPLVVLLDIALRGRYGWLLICVHLVVFPRPVYRVARDFWQLTFYKPHNKI